MNNENIVFVVNDETRENSHGFYLRNSGLRRSRYDRNPVLLFNHDDSVIIGRVEELHTENHLLLMSPVFDESDNEAMKVKSKIENRFLKGCSPGIIIHKVDVELNAVGEDRYVVTDWELCEISIVSVPSNDGALKLYDKKGKALSENEIEKLKINSSELKQKSMKEKFEVKLTEAAEKALKLQPGYDLNAISEAATALAEQNSAMLKARAEALVDGAIRDGKLSTAKRDKFIELALKDFCLASETIAGIPKQERLSTRVKETKGGATSGREDWSYLRWAKEDPDGLARLKQEDPEEFERLKKLL